MLDRRVNQCQPGLTRVMHLAYWGQPGCTGRTGVATRQHQTGLGAGHRGWALHMAPALLLSATLFKHKGD